MICEIVGRLTYNIFSISKSLLLYMFGGLGGSFGWSLVVFFFFGCFSLSTGLLLVLLDLFLIRLLFWLLFMGLFLCFWLFVLFLHIFSMILHLFSMLLHLFLMLLLHFFFRRFDLWILQFFLGIDWSFSAFFGSRSRDWHWMYWFFICWFFYFCLINDWSFRIMNGSRFVIVHLFVTCVLLLFFPVLLSFFLFMLILMSFCRFFLNHQALVVEVSCADSISSSCGRLDLDILTIGAMIGI